MTAAAGAPVLAPLLQDPVVLEPLVLELQRQPGPLLRQIQQALAAHGQPVRWAITAVASGPAAAGGGMLPGTGGAVLRIEAVVLRTPAARGAALALQPPALSPQEQPAP